MTGATCAPGDALIGLPSSGLHSNGYSLARAALGSLALDARPAELGGASVADALLEPTVIYVRAVLELLRSGLDVRGLAHITGGGVLNLLRLHADVGFQIDAPLPVPPVFGLVQALGDVPDAEMWEVFNMGCGFCAVVPAAQAEDAVALLGRHHPGTARIGSVTADADRVSVPALGLTFSLACLRPRPRARPRPSPRARPSSPGAGAGDRAVALLGVPVVLGGVDAVVEVVLLLLHVGELVLELLRALLVAFHHPSWCAAASSASPRSSSFSFR